MMRLDVRAMDRAWRERLLAKLTELVAAGQYDAVEKPLANAIAAALRDGVATFPEPEMRFQTREA